MHAMQENLKLGILIFLAMTTIILTVLRATRHHHAIRDTIKYPLVIIFLLLTFFDTMYVFGEPLPSMMEKYYFALLYLSIATLLIRLSILFFFDFFLVRSRHYRAPRLLKEIASVILFSLALLFIIQDTLKIQVTTLLATSAIITVVLGLALQETLGNLFAGLALHLDPPYQAGDWIRTGENVGKVVEVTWRATKLRTTNNDFIVIPNGQIAKEKVTNHSYPRTPHATRVNVAVAYKSPPNKVASVIRQVLESIDNVSMDPPPEIRVNAYQDFSIDYQIKFYYKDFGLIEPTVAAVKKALWYHFRRNEIEIPFPIRNIYMHDRDEMFTVREQKLRDLSESLQKVDLFAPMDDEERRLIAEHLVEQHFAQGELIIREGESGDSFYIIEEGQVEVFLTSQHGNRKVLSSLSSGDFFGEMALLTGERRAASVEAISDVRVYKLAKEGFREILDRKPGILDEIGSVLSRRKGEMFDLMAETTDHGESASMNVQEVKSRILGRIRSYFGL